MLKQFLRLSTLILLSAGPAWASTQEMTAHPAEPKAPSAAEPTPPSVPSAPPPTASEPAADSKSAAKEKAGVSKPKSGRIASPSTRGLPGDDEVTTPIPPSLTQRALCDELRKTAKERASFQKQLEDEKKAVAAEKAHLEEIVADITKQRQALKEETARLEALLARASGEAPKTAGAPAAKPIKPDFEGLAKTVRSMKPDQAASLITRVDRDLGAKVLSRMKPQDAGAILEKLKPELAADLLADMASLPAPKKGGK
jgi:flagellar motility protein MotE (MotC chaperone)